MSIKLLRTPKWQVDLFHTYYVASTNKKQAIDVTIYHDIAKVCIYSHDYEQSFHAKLIDCVTDRVARKCAFAVNNNQPEAMRWYWDALTSITHVWNMAQDEEAFELCHNCKLLIDAVCRLPEYERFFLSVMFNNLDRLPSNLLAHIASLPKYVSK